MAQQGPERGRRRRPARDDRALVARDTLVLTLIALLLVALFGTRTPAESAGRDKWFGFALSIRAPSLHLHLELSV